MKKNSPWLNEINLAMSSVINDGVVHKSYAYHMDNKCSALSKGDNVKALTLSNLGSLFAMAAIIAFCLCIVKVYLLVTKRKVRRQSVRPSESTGSKELSVIFGNSISQPSLKSFDLKGSTVGLQNAQLS